MAFAELRKSHIEGIFVHPSSPAAWRLRPPSPIVSKERLSLAAAGQSSLTRSTPSLPARPSSRQSECDDDATWQRQQRASIKKSYMLRTSSNPLLSSASSMNVEDKHQLVHKIAPARTEQGGDDSPDRRKDQEFRDFRKGDANYCLRKAPRRLPPVQGAKPVFADRNRISATLNGEPKLFGNSDKFDDVLEKKRASRNSQVLASACSEDKIDDVLEKKRASQNPQALASACWEDMISFLELNKLSGAYALAFSAYGINDLPSLLRLDDSALGSLLEKCNIDSMEQILLLEAIRGSNPFR